MPATPQGAGRVLAAATAWPQNVIVGLMMVHQLKALASETRLQIMAWLRAPEAHFPAQAHGDPVGIGVCVSHIQQKAGLSPSTASTHLAILQRAELVCATRIGKWTYYRRNEAAIVTLLDDMTRVV